jgi:hypothetical protein
MEKNEYENFCRELTTEENRQIILQTDNWVKQAGINDYDFAKILIESAIKYGFDTIKSNYDILAAMTSNPIQLKNQLTRYLKSLATVNLGDDMDVYVLYKSSPSFSKKLNKNIVKLVLYTRNNIYFTLVYLPADNTGRLSQEINQIKPQTAYKMNVLIDSAGNLRLGKYINAKPSTMSAPSLEELLNALEMKYPKLNTKLSIDEILSKPIEYYMSGLLGEVLQESSSRIIFQFFPDSENEDDDILPDIQFIVGLDKSMNFDTHDHIAFVGIPIQSKNNINSLIIFPNFVMTLVKSKHSVDSNETSMY